MAFRCAHRQPKAKDGTSDLCPRPSLLGLVLAASLDSPTQLMAYKHTQRAINTIIHRVPSLMMPDLGAA